MAVFVAPESRRGAIGARSRPWSQAGGEMLDDDVAQHEWEERFNLMASSGWGPASPRPR